MFGLLFTNMNDEKNMIKVGGIHATKRQKQPFTFIVQDVIGSNNKIT